MDETEDRAVELRRVDLSQARSGLSRLEPMRGFVPGHRYRFWAERDGEILRSFFESDTRTGEQVLSVEIGKHTLESLDGVGFARRGTTHEVQIEVPSAGACHQQAKAYVATIEWTLPVALAPYRESLKYRPVDADTGEPWRFRSSLCGNERITLADEPPGITDIYYSQQTRGVVGKALSYLEMHRFRGDWAFFELEDRVQEGQVVAFHFQCDLEGIGCPELPEPAPPESPSRPARSLVWLFVGGLALLGAVASYLAIRRR